MNIAKMMKQAQQMQKKMGEMQEELAAKEVQASVAGGKVTVVASGAGDVLSIKIDPAVVDPEDVELLEDLVLSAVKQAIEQGKAMSQTEMGKLTAGLGLPPGLGF
ncbi:MAG: YbaB/EbfC family nucleoid-associated protein [Verrucomicrobiales bacterium]|jgi:DNA-binding YbaB/EbfC family protein|nr:YbaB/EbfC family nucleoid-associated protein [Verrucomicrobiales bacterium]MDP4792406.1 YbaB/EbfC family nucleoid-associated protein [Verrucomicrobiales bacterium]MDP4849250.1 YbaB/EbfC family nucleoid-associated protein [Verrucomicrobiales bacterium]MDP4938436.1 YbaB/EbfC family nucleoid-associated protein [Verrucomicrobiales bacterium]MDP5005082.1 YbaB/EbfC family nucleoid-associated protein [Verrucomicrobiales bacterium]